MYPEAICMVTKTYVFFCFHLAQYVLELNLLRLTDMYEKRSGKDIMLESER